MVNLVQETPKYLKKYKMTVAASRRMIIIYTLVNFCFIMILHEFAVGRIVLHVDIYRKKRYNGSDNLTALPQGRNHWIMTLDSIFSGIVMV